jgi:hypothetical protein
MALTDNIAHYWKLDESSGNASDSVGSVTLTNTNTITYSSGKINNGANLVALSNHRFVASSFTITAAFSISFWMYRTSAWVGGYMFSSPTVSSTACIQITVRTDDNKIAYSNFINEVVSASTVAATTWTHVVVTSDGTNSVIYINGSSDATSSSVGHTSSAQTYNLGRRSDNDTAYYDGSLDEVGIWDRALTSGEVTSLYNSGTGSQYPFVTNYPLTAGVGSFTLTGNDAGLLFGRNLVAGVGSFTLTGIDVLFSLGKGMIASVGTFVLTGIDAALRYSGWTNRSKTTDTSWTEETKNSSTWTNIDKN